MKKGITSLIDSIVEKNPYDYSLWENIFTVKSESEVFERALEFFPTSPIVWKRYIEYLQNQKNIDEKGLLAIFQRCVHQCPCIMIWKLFIPFVDETVKSLKDRYQIYQLALETVGSDPRSGFLWQRMYKLRLLVYNTLISKSENNFAGSTLLLNPFETSTIPLISDKVDECFSLGDKIATIVTLRQFFIQWLTTPVGNLETAFIAYSLFENSISSGNDIQNMSILPGGVVSTSESASKILTKNLLQSGEKLVNTSKLVYKNIMLLIDNLQEDIPAKPLDKSNKNEWLNKFVPWKKYILFEKSNPLGLDKNQYFNRVSYSYRNCLLYFSYHPEIWYEYFIFVWNYHPVQTTGVDMATELLNSAIQRFLPKDEVLKLVLAEVYELRRKLDKVMYLYQSMVYIENSNDIIQNKDDINNKKDVNKNESLKTMSDVDVKSNILSQSYDIDRQKNDINVSISNTEYNVKVSEENNELVDFSTSIINNNNKSDNFNDNANNFNNNNLNNINDNNNTNINNNDININDINDNSNLNLNKYASIITAGMNSKQYNPNVSAVVIIEYLNFILRSTNDKVIWREVFLDYVKRSPNIKDMKWICFSQALNEWRLYNNLEGAYQIFYFGMYYRHLFLDVSFMSCFISFLLDTGKLQQARSILQSCIYEIYKETGKVPKQLWLQWFNLERMSGSSIYTLNYLNRIYQLQKDGENVEIDMLLSNRQQQAWHSILGAPEFAELNKEFIGNDNVDPKTKVYGHSYIVNPFEDDNSIENTVNNNLNYSNNNVNTSNNSGNLNPNINNSAGVSNSSNFRVRPSLNSNKFILTCPNKFRTAFECFKFGSIYPNSSWAEFYMNNGDFLGEDSFKINNSSINSDIHSDKEERVGNYTLKNDKDFVNTDMNLINKNSGLCKRNISSKNIEDDDDFENFLLQKPLEFRLTQGILKKSNMNDDYENSDIESIDGMDDEDMEYYYYYSKNSDITHINEFVWSRIGRSLCSKPDTSNMVKFIPGGYPTKSNSIIDTTNIDRKLELKKYLNQINNGDLNNLDLSNMNYFLEGKAFNMQIPKGIIDFVALLPPSNLPNTTIRNSLGITQEVIDYLITTLQTVVLPQKIDLYKYTPISFQNKNSFHDNQNENFKANKDEVKSLDSSTNMNTLQEIIQKSIPWYSDNNNLSSNQQINAVNNEDKGSNFDRTVNDSLSINNSFFTPCNVPTSNRFSNKPKNQNSKVQIQL